MQRFFPPILLSGVILGLLVAIGGGNVGLARETAPDPVDRAPLNVNGVAQVWECIAIVHGDSQNEPVVLETANFGFDYVEVNRPEFFCESAVKSNVDSFFEPDDQRILVCFSIRRGDDPNDPVTLDTDNFPDDDVWVRRATYMCEEGAKFRVEESTTNDEGEEVVDKDDPRFGNPFGNATGIVWECFTLENGNDPDQEFYLSTQNFGVDRVTVRKSGLMCEPALKSRLLRVSSVGPAQVAVFPDEDILQCFRIIGGVKLEEELLLLGTQNFGEDRVQMRNGSMMCEPAEKTSYLEDFDITTGPPVPP